MVILKLDRLTTAWFCWTFLFVGNEIQYKIQKMPKNKK
jgi:hypothetical protein